MSTFPMLDAAGRPRSPATIPGNLAGRAPRNKGRRYPADPPRVEEIVAVLRRAGQGPHGARTRGLIVVLWRAGLRISEALELAERDLDPAAARSWSAPARAASDVRSGWTTGLGAASALAPAQSRDADWRTLLRRQRTDMRTTVVGAGGPRTAAPARRSSRRPKALCPASASPRARRRDGPRGHAAQRDPAPARTCRPRGHFRSTCKGSTTPR
jgi:integrase